MEGADEFFGLVGNDPREGGGLVQTGALRRLVRFGQTLNLLVNPGSQCLCSSHPF